MDKTAKSILDYKMAKRLLNYKETFDKIKYVPHYHEIGEISESGCKMWLFMGKLRDEEDEKYLDGEFRMFCNIVNPEYNRESNAEILNELETAGIDDILGFVYYETYRFVVSKGGVYHFWTNDKVFLTLNSNVDIYKHTGISPEMIGILKNTNKHIYVMSSNDPLSRKLEFILIDRDNPSDYTNIKTDIVLKPNWQHHLIAEHNLIRSDDSQEYKYRLVLYDNKKTILVYNLNNIKLIEFDRKIIIPGKNISIHICGPYIAIAGDKKFINIDDF